MEKSIFLNNKYTKWYFNIIESVKCKNRIKLRKSDISYVYYENHHIVPKSLGGSDIKTNLVLLTLKEHYIVHLLLCNMQQTKNNRYKMIDAFRRFCYGNDETKHTRRKYEYWKYLEIEKYNDGIWMSSFKNKISNTRKNQYKNPIFAVKHKQIQNNRTLGKSLEEIYGEEKAIEMKNKISSTIKLMYKNCEITLPDRVGENNGMYGKNHSLETKKKISEKSKIHSKGEGNGMYGKNHTDETKKKQSELRKNTIHITNGIISKVIHKSDIIPEGWHKGRIIDGDAISKRMTTYRSDTKFINNGLETIVIKSTDDLPEGYTYGRLMKFKITNGLENKSVSGKELKQYQDMGWHRGWLT